MKNELYTGIVQDYTHDGKGIIKMDGYPIFTKDTILDEQVEVRIIKDKKKYGFGKVENIITPSNSRVVPECEYYNQCGGCQLSFMDYNQQIKFKEKKIINAFKKQDIVLDNHNFSVNDSPFNYRNKLSVPLAKNNSIYAGLYRENTNDIIKINKCLIQEDCINEVMQNVVALLNKYNINIYNKFRHKGFLRQLIIREASNSNEILVGFVVNAQNYLGELDNLINELVVDTRIKSVVVNLNNKNTNVIVGTKNVIVYGNGYIIDRVDDFIFQISLNSFYQINTNQMAKLYKSAIEMANLSKDDVVLDAYCGVGTITSYLAKSVKSVVGVDMIKSAIQDAKMNSELNDIKNVKFICKDVNDFIAENATNFDAVVIDPPRKGCSVEFLDHLIELQTNKIIYISCDVATQARDVRKLIDSGYQIESSCAHDMFSQTHHVENIIILIKK